MFLSCSRVCVCAADSERAHPCGLRWELGTIMKFVKAKALRLRIKTKTIFKNWEHAPDSSTENTEFPSKAFWDGRRIRSHIFVSAVGFCLCSAAAPSRPSSANLKHRGFLELAREPGLESLTGSKSR